MKDALDFDIKNADTAGNLIIEASAGTGKTYSLERLFLGYIADRGYNIGEILAVTFTEKAALELRTRIRALLAEMVSDPEVRKDRIAAGRLDKAFSEFTDSQIYTIHGFCSFCIQNYPFECSAPFRSNVINTPELYREAVLDYFRAARDDELSECYLSFRKKTGSFNNAADTLVSLLSGRLISGSDCVIPGAAEKRLAGEYISSFRQGNGELFSALALLRGCDTGPEILASVAKKMKVRFASATFNKLSSALQQAASADSVFGFFSCSFADEAERLMKLSLSALAEKGDISVLDYGEKALSAAIDAVMRAALPFADRTEDGSIRWIYHNIAGYLFIESAAGKIRALAERKKRSTSSIDFNDMIEITRKALEGEETALAGELRRRYRVVLVDEFQDTDEAQWAIFSSVFLRPPHRIVLIGDPKQSIYRFRGADLEVYFRATESLPNSASYRLSVCYRSAEPVIRGINEIFRMVFSKRCGGGHSISYKDVKPSPGEVKGEKKALQLKSGIEIFLLENNQQTMSKETVSALLYAACADETARLLGEGLPPSSVCMLLETNDDCKDMLEQLNRRNIPAYYEGETDVFASPEAYLFIDLLYALSDPNNISLVKKVLFSDFFNYPAALIAEMERDRRLEKAVVRFVYWASLAETGRIYMVFDQLLYGNDPAGTEPAEQAMTDIKNAGKPDLSGAEPGMTYIARKLSEVSGERKVSNVLQISEMLVSRNMKEKENCRALLRFVVSAVGGFEKSDGSVSRLEREPECVKVMTIHKSKGLEFPVVFFAAGLGSCRSRRGKQLWHEYIENGTRVADFSMRNESALKQTGELIEEKKRLYYVAMTRASVKLYLPAANFYPDCDLLWLYASAAGDKLEGITASKGITYDPVMGIGRTVKDNAMTLTAAREVLSGCLNSFLEELCRRSGSFTLRRIKTDDIHEKVIRHAQVSGFGKEAPELETPLYDRDRASSGYALYSYSSLASAGSHHKRLATAKGQDIIRQIGERERDVEEEAAGDETGLDGLEGIKGSDFGNIMHSALETADYLNVMSFSSEETAAGDSSLLGFAESCARTHVSSEQAARCSKTVVLLLYRTLNTVITAGDDEIRIGDIPENQRRHEVEFIMKVRNGKTLFPGAFSGMVLEEGYLKGFIDMVFIHRDRYYIIDWKTNNLGSNSRDYGYENLAIAMEEGNYYLQMNIYMTALEMITGIRGKKDSAARLGGCFYLFLRGLTGMKGSSTGIFNCMPDNAAIDDFRKTFTGAEGKIEA